jgi:chemotaxis protein methyltransferase CheR
MLRFETTGEELQKLVNLMTVNETYFFREEYQFKCLVDSILPEIVRKKTDDSPIRIWSVPSSSGEEAYSIAIYLLEHWSGIDRWDVEIISSDIDTEIISQAKKGHYSPRSVQNLPDKILHKYFTYKNEGYQICRDLQQAVEFTRVNIMEPLEVRSYRNMDVIFCRNLLIYFDDVSRRYAAEMFFDAMKAGGFVCLGHSESMSRISSLFRVCKFPEAIVYQKPLESR